MNISIIAFTDRGRELSRRIGGHLPEDTVNLYAKAEGFLPYSSLRDFAQRAMAEDDAVIFVGATGIAVRAIAPFVRRKDLDPAVLVIDENGRFAISLLSGHIGGANRLAQRLAEQLHAIPVVTTATDGRGVFAADQWATEHRCTVRNLRAIQQISGALLEGESVGLHSDFPITGTLPEGVVLDTRENGIGISIYQRENNPFPHTLWLTPQIVHVGVGCRRNTSPEKLVTWAQEQLQALQIDPRAVASVASINLKQDEPAVYRLAEQWQVPVVFYTAQQLEQVQGAFPPSDFVRHTTGTDNVCQRAAAKAAGNGTCLLEKTAQDGMTISMYCEDWRTAF